VGEFKAKRASKKREKGSFPGAFCAVEKAGAHGFDLVNLPAANLENLGAATGA